MASLPNPAYRTTTVAEFLAMDIGDAKAELVDGLIYMMAGGSVRHAAIAANLIAALLPRLRGTGCRPYGSDLAMQTGPATIRFPDVSVYCRDTPPPADPHPKLLGDPRVVIEILSPSTASNDQITKLAEYRARPGVEQIIFIDPDTERVRIVAARSPEDSDADWLPAGSDVPLVSLGIVVPWAEIFAEE